MAAPGAERPSESGRRVPRLPALRLRTRLARGEQRAFAELFERHHQELYRYCMALLRDPDDAQDALQATLTAALESLPGDAREIEPRPWLFRVAHNKAISMLRERSHDELPRDAAAPAADPSETHAASERLRRLVDDLNALPERQRSALVMRELSDLRYAEIARALDCGEGAARQAVYEARLGLREREAGREMSCDSVQRALSEGDRRKLRGLRIRAHLRQCDSCLAFQHSIESRRDDLRALAAPLPLAAAGSLLAATLTSGAGSAGGAIGAGAVGGGAAAGGTIAVKGASIAAGVVLAVGAADVSGLVELPKPGGSQQSAQTSSELGAGEGTGTAADGSAASRQATEPGTPAAEQGTGSPAGQKRARRGEGEARRKPHLGSPPGSAAPPDSAAPGSGDRGVAAPPGGASADARGNSDNAPGRTGQTPGQGGVMPPGATRPHGAPAAPATSARPEIRPPGSPKPTPSGSSPPSPPGPPQGAGSPDSGSGHGANPVGR